MQQPSRIFSLFPFLFCIQGWNSPNYSSESQFCFQWCPFCDFILERVFLFLLGVGRGGDNHAFHFWEFLIFLGLLYLSSLLCSSDVSPEGGIWIFFHISPQFLQLSLFHRWSLIREVLFLIIVSLFQSLFTADRSFHIPNNLGDCGLS